MPPPAGRRRAASRLRGPRGPQGVGTGRVGTGRSTSTARRAGRRRRREEIVSVEMLSADRHEEASRPDAARVARDIADLDVFGAGRPFRVDPSRRAPRRTPGPPPRSGRRGAIPPPGEAVEAGLENRGERRFHRRSPLGSPGLRAGPTGTARSGAPSGGSSASPSDSPSDSSSGAVRPSAGEAGGGRRNDFGADPAGGRRVGFPMGFPIGKARGGGPEARRPGFRRPVAVPGGAEAEGAEARRVRRPAEGEGGGVPRRGAGPPRFRAARPGGKPGAASRSRRRIGSVPPAAGSPPDAGVLPAGASRPPAARPPSRSAGSAAGPAPRSGRRRGPRSRRCGSACGCRG